MKTEIATMLRQIAFALLCLQPILCSENDYFFSHLLRHLKNDILNLKPGSNKTYIINSKLLGRNDSIELDIKSRAKGLHNDKDNMNNKATNHDTGGPHKIRHAHHKLSLKDRKVRKELRNKIRKGMMREFEAIQGKHRLKIRKIMKHKEQENGERKKIRIKVRRTHKADEQRTANKTEAKPEVKLVKKIKILHLPVVRKMKAQRKRKIAANGHEGLEFGEEQDEDDSAFDEGGQIPEFFGGDDIDEEQVSAYFRNTKDLVEYVVSSTTTATTTTTTEPSTKNLKDEYTYEYVYEDELDKNKSKPKKRKHGEEDGKKAKGATSDEYTYEYIYEDEMKKGKASTAAPTTKRPETTTTAPPPTSRVSEETPAMSEETDEEPNSKRHQPVKLSPSVEEEIIKLRELELNCTRASFASEEYEGDSNSQYKVPERFQYEEEQNPASMSDYSIEYDWNAPAKTTHAVTYKIAASSIMYDDENTEEFYAERNKTKRERGYDSYPADQIFTCDLRKLHHRYTRPQLTPEDYESFDNYIDHWGSWDDQLGHSKEKSRPNKSRPTKAPLGHTHPCNVTKRRGLYNMTVRERTSIRQFNLDEFLRNSTALWMRNVTQSTTAVQNDPDEAFVTMFDLNGIQLPQERKLRRQKRDIGGGMKMPRRQWEMLMYLFQKVNHTRWIARLNKMRKAPNLMELLIRRDKKKVNKKSLVYKQKAVKPKKRPKGPKRVVFKKRKPMDNRRDVRVKLAAKRRQKKQSLQRRRRSVDNMAQSNRNNMNERYIDIKELDENINDERNKRALEKVEEKLVRKKRKTDKLSDDLLSDFQNNPEKMTGTIENMTDIFQANLLETHKMSIDKAMNQAIEKFESAKDVKDFNKTEEIKVYRTFICEYKQLMEEWFVSMFFDVPNAMRRFAKKNIFKLRKDRVPSTAQVNKFFEYDNYLNVRLEMTERVIRSTMKHFYDELEDKVFGYFYGFDRTQKLFEDPYSDLNRTTLSDRDLLRLLAKTTQYDPDAMRSEMKEASERMIGLTDKYGNTLEPLPDGRWK